MIDKKYYVKMIKLTLQDKIKKNQFFRIMKATDSDSDLSSSNISKSSANIYI